MKNSEHREQAALFKWAKLNERKHPELALMFAVPNGGHRHIFVARKLKAEGVKAGVPDICLPVPRGDYAGLWIELKVKGNKPTEVQRQWHKNLADAGHRVEVCYSWSEAKNAILYYLGL